MKNKMLISYVMMIAGVFGLSLILPWWTACVWIIFVSAFNRLTPKQAILAGSISFGFVWLCMAFYMSMLDDTNLITKTGALLHLSNGLMMVATFVIGLVSGLLSGWLGSGLGYVLRPEKRTSA
ncbi:MAG: hypothetical protein ABIQ02_00615 [Saprospiraceae bacterium]